MVADREFVEMVGTRADCVTLAGVLDMLSDLCKHQHMVLLLMQPPIVDTVVGHCAMKACGLIYRKLTRCSTLQLSMT